MLRIRDMTRDDVPAALQLSTQAGWNQLQADWQRLIKLWPNACIVGECDGRVVGTATLACYGTDIAWIGMILVDESQRGKGFGGAMFDAIVNRGHELDMQVLGLDATDLGRPLYLKRGFVDTGGIDRWMGVAQPSHRSKDITEDIDPHWIAMAQLDQQASGVDRLPLLRHLANEAQAITRACVENGNLLGFGIARTGRTAAAIGPVVATRPALGSSIIQSLLHAIHERKGQHPAMIDVPRNAAVCETLTQLGFEVKRKLTRMVSPANDEFMTLNPQIIAGAGFELG